MIRHSRGCVFLGFALLVTPIAIELSASAVRANEKDIAQLLNEVGQIPVRGSPGAIIPFGPDAFPLIVGDAGDGRLLPVAAAGRLGKGRIVAFSHGAYLGDVPTDDWKRLILNAVEWAGGTPRGKKQGPNRIATFNYDNLRNLLNASGYKATAVDADTWKKQLSQCDVLCIDTAFEDNAELADAVSKFVQSGGGLVTAGTGWGWAQTTEKSLADDFLGNRVLMPAGLVVTDNMPGGNGDQYKVQLPPPKLANAWEALSFLAENPTKAKMTPKEKKKKANAKKLDTDTDEAAQATFVLETAIRYLSPSEPILWPRIRQLVKGTTAAPRPGWPIASDNFLNRLAVVAEDAALTRLPPEKVKAHPAAAGFPFAVPADAQPTTAKRAIDTKIPDWHSLGLYAAPGALITVTVPKKASGANLAVRIGCHTDTLWGLPTWERWPSICRRVVIKSPTTLIANPFGGLVYIDVPNDCPLGTIQVSIAGAVESPLYVLGKTELADWKKTIRSRPGPWAELVCAGVIVTVPSKSVRNLENPKAVMEFWNRAVELQDELAMYKPGERKRPERFVADQQISMGYMHSGYPIMAGNDVYDANVSVAQLRGTKKEPGGWGQWHELGHNHQVDDWTPNSTGEVTVNLFTMYVINKLHGVTIDASRPDHLSAENRRLRIHEYLKSNRTANDWDAFEGLIMYYQLVDAFGWKKLQDVFAEYRKLSDKERPQNDAEKWDQWMVRYSRTVNKNLGPFFVRWRVPVSKQALNSIRTLPPWMHDDFAAIRK